MKLKDLCIFSVYFTLMSCNNITTFLGKSNIEEVVNAMTTEEKLHIVIGGKINENSGGSAVIGATEKYVSGAAGNTCEVKRLGITPIVLADGPAGLRIDSTRKNDNKTYYATHFPIGTLLASTWNTELVKQVGYCIGNEAKEYGVDILLAPAINIHRNPLCGRNFEYYSEDPLLAGKIGAAFIKGVQSNGIGTSLKHFAVNNQETNRQGVNACVSQRALREIYLKGFEIAVKEAKPWTIMSSYNLINGVYTSQSHDLLTTLLRYEWGFNGIVMTDWYGGKDAVKQLKAGNDLLMPGRTAQYDQLKAGLKTGSLNKGNIDLNVKRILQIIERTQRFKGFKYSNNPDLKTHAAISRQSATEGMVLLKNERVLPLRKSVKKVALFGCTSYKFIPGGTGSGNVNSAYTVSLLDGLRNHGIATDTKLQRQYEDYWIYANSHAKKPTSQYAHFLPTPLPAEINFSEEELGRLAKEQDAAIITLGRLSGEFADRPLSDFFLSKEEQTLIYDVCKAFHKEDKKIIVLLNIGGVIETSSWKNMPDAILCAWQGGQEGGNSVADILTGKTCPSGKLPMTFPVNYEDVASAANFPNDSPQVEFNLNGAEETKHIRKNIDYTIYEEDIYVGYRYFESFNKPVSYPFGFGLSYTQFDYSNAKAVIDGDSINVTLEVKNVGKVSGKDVVELYVSAPNNMIYNKPEHELKAFAKTHELQPGESCHVILKMKQADMASYDEIAQGWKVDAGKYIIKLGSSSRDIKAHTYVELHSSFIKCSNILVSESAIKKLKRH